jgi:hypothetical protein
MNMRGFDADRIMPVDTRSIAARREFRFSTIDQALAHGRHLVDLECAGRLQSLGNWTLGQTLGHLATWAEFSYTGAPLNPPWFIKLLLRLRKKKFLYGAMPAGVKIPKVQNGTLGTDVLSTDEGLHRFERAFTRLKSEAPTKPHLLFGPLKHEEWIAVNLRHAELHLSFFTER